MLAWICFPPFLMVILLMFVMPCLAAVISPTVAKANSLLLTTPLEVFNLSWGYDLHLIMWKLFYLEDIFFLPPAVHFNKQVSISCFLYIFGGSSHWEIFFCLARQTSTKDSMIMNQAESVASFSKSNSDKSFFSFFVRRYHK